MTTTAATTIALTPAVASTPTTTWAGVAEGLWAGSRAGEFRGTIEFVAGRFEATDHHGTRLGHSHSLAGAQRLIDEPDGAAVETTLPWADERATLALGWVAFAAAAFAAVSIASQFFV